MRCACKALTRQGRILNFFLGGGTYRVKIASKTMFGNGLVQIVQPTVNVVITSAADKGGGEGK